ncbi:TetR family transcriptional regulator C-terminal domain-containing protein [Glaciecola petra]|uniref:TetR family transcriptional regulator C-terminal domain-containing protein n=1 Tax=Glaciecola petra TaxID=3075602 RepID=A0ABU2ZU76_9ALTE|nr:TetR family transcriptional regulator C-terminal domain-containing protein [Aestuariibacter sp. P117]MDT0596176.1 TetR family transcriptional regulator C-terminal domain-containing protein [Aestuariibacter sp. P117]
MNTKEKNATNSIGDKRRKSILKAAEKVFAQNGFKGGSIQMIAKQANLPKTNVLYYFKSKLALYQALVNEILHTWNSSFDQVTENDDPAHSLAQYIAEKMEMSRKNPNASKIFGLEILNGAQSFDATFKQNHKIWFDGRVKVINAWIANGKLAPINAEYLLFHIWASTQHYADFATQIKDLRNKAMSKSDYQEATQHVIKLILQGCGLKVPTHFLEKPQ